jgi:hypothetical protein
MKRLTVQSNSFSHPEVVGFLFQTPPTSLQFHSTTGNNGRAAMPKRSASQQPVVRQDNSNPHLRRALPVAVGGTPADLHLDLEFPGFAGIAARRDAPLKLSLAGNRLQASAQLTGTNTVPSEFDSKKTFVEQPLFRDRGIND